MPIKNKISKNKSKDEIGISNNHHKILSIGIKNPASKSKKNFKTNSIESQKQNHLIEFSTYKDEIDYEVMLSLEALKSETLANRKAYNNIDKFINKNYSRPSLNGALSKNEAFNLSALSVNSNFSTVNNSEKIEKISVKISNEKKVSKLENVINENILSSTVKNKTKKTKAKL